MIFFKRDDLDAQARFNLALAMYNRGVDDWGLVTELAKRHNVSREFLYQNARLIENAFQAHAAVPAENLSSIDFDKLLLCLRLYCKSSIDGITRLFKEMGWNCGSAGYVSEFLSAVASRCAIEIPAMEHPVIFLLDETFANGEPILVAMEALSHYIYAICFASDRKAETWEEALKKLQAAGVDIGLNVKDQGGSLKAAVKELRLTERADLFHLLKPFDPFLGHLERRAYGAIENEHERLRVFGNRKTRESRQKARKQYKQARREADQAIRRSDNYDYLHLCLHEAFNSFSCEGRLRTKAEAENDLMAAMELIETEFACHQKILDAVKFLRQNLSDYWSYFEQLEQIVAGYAGIIPEYSLHAACLSWQLDRKSRAVKSGSLKKKFARRAKDLLEFILTGADNKFNDKVKALFAELDSNVRSSSPLEAINSVIRTTLNSCRGQITQETLNMIAFFMNHRQAFRGRYAGSSPYERLTGISEKGSPIEKILELSSRYAGNTFAGKEQAAPELVLLKAS